MRPRRRETEGWDTFSEEFTFRPDLPSPGNPKSFTGKDRDEFWLYHTTYGLSCGFPLCCVIHWTNQAAGRRKGARKDIGLRHRTGHNALGQHFVLCPKETHDETWYEYVVHGNVFGDCPSDDPAKRKFTIECVCDDCIPEKELKEDGPP